MAEIIGVGSLSITDINDAIITTNGVPPRNPTEDMLWIDNSEGTPVLKVYNNGSWVVQHLDVNNLDPDLKETINTVLATLGSIADDGKMDFNERKRVAQEVASIIGELPSKVNGNVYTNTLPTHTTLDSKGVGSFAYAREIARNATIPTTASLYIELRVAYDELNSFLSAQTPKSWDITDTNKNRIVTITDPDRFREVFLNYYMAELRLTTEAEKKAKEALENYTDEAVKDAITSVDVEYAKNTSATTAPITGWQTTPPTWENGAFIWSRTTTVYKDGTKETTNPVNITGATGASGGTGTAGRSITNIQEQYYLSTSPTALVGGSWTNTPPAWRENMFMWTRSSITFTNPSGTITTDPISVTGSKGSPGRSVDKMTEQYYLSDSKTTQVGGSWTTTAPTWSKGKYMWTRMKIDYSNPTGTEYTTPVIDSSWEAVEIVDGELRTVIERVDEAEQVIEDDNITNIVRQSTLYKDDLSGKVSNNEVISRINQTAEKLTIDVNKVDINGKLTISAFNPDLKKDFDAKATKAELENISLTPGKSAYELAVARGYTGTEAQWIASLKGSDGKGVVSTTVTYQIHTSGNSAPTGPWSTTVPSPIQGRYLWTRTITRYSDNSEITTYSVAYTATDGQAGTPGTGISSTAIHYQISTSGTAVPTGTWATSLPTPIQGRYLWARMVVNYTNGTSATSYNTSYYATDGQKGDKGEPGANGISVTATDIEFYLSTSATSLVGGSWVTTAPNWVNGRFMWTRTKTTYSSGNPTYTNPVNVTGATGSTGSTGSAGRGISNVQEQYYLSTSKTSQTGGSWVTSSPTWVPGRYVWTRIVITYVNPSGTDTTTPVIDSSWESIDGVQKEVTAIKTKTDKWSWNNTTEIDGGNIRTKTIRAEDIIANNLSAMSANLGTVTAGIIRSQLANSRFTELNLGNGSYTSRGVYVSSLDVPSVAVSSVTTIQDGQVKSEEVGGGINRWASLGAGEVSVSMNPSEWAKLNGRNLLMNEFISGYHDKSELTASKLLFTEAGNKSTELSKEGLKIGGVLIVDSGTGSNGSWLRFQNGIQICWHTVSPVIPCNQGVGSLFRSNIHTWTFPVSYVSTPHLVVSARRQGGGILFGGDNGEANTLRANNLRLLSPTNDGAGNIIGIAIGYWKWT